MSKTKKAVRVKRGKARAVASASNKARMGTGLPTIREERAERVRRNPRTGPHSTKTQATRLEQGPTGRPRAVLSPLEAGKLAAMQCTHEEIAAFFGVHPSTLTKRKQEDEELATAIEEGYAKGRASLRLAQFRSAQGTNGKSGNVVMQIWLGKQYLGQADKVETKNDTQLSLAEQIKAAIVKVRSQNAQTQPDADDEDESGD